MTEILNGMITFIQQMGLTPIINGFFALAAAIYFIRTIFLRDR